MKPEAADGYALNLSDAAKQALGDLTSDPAVAAVREAALAKGWTQGEFDDRIGQTLDILAEKGLLQPTFDAAAELAKLGDNGQVRRQELEIFANALKTRNEIDADMHAELMTLAPTAAGVKLVEFFRKEMGAKGQMQTPQAGDADPAGDAARAKAMRADPRYGTDPKFRKQADDLAMASYGKR